MDGIHFQEATIGEDLAGVFTIVHVASCCSKNLSLSFHFASHLSYQIQGDFSHAIGCFVFLKELPKSFTISLMEGIHLPQAMMAK